jgi:hypothetical protein
MKTGVLLCLLLAASLSLLSCRRNHPPDIPSPPSGPSSLWPSESGEFWASTNDRDFDDSISFQFDWGGGDTSAWTPFSESASAVLHHAWLNQGVYGVRVRARDDKNAESGWSDSLTVSIAAVGFAPNVSVDQGRSCGSPSIAIGPSSGEYQPIYVAMQDGWSIAFQKSTDGGVSWLADNQVVCQGSYPDVTTDFRGNVYVAFTENDSSDAYSMHCALSTDGGITWSAPVRINDDTASGSAMLGSLTADAAGNLFCAWSDSRTGQSRIWSSVSTDQGATWGRNVRVCDCPDTAHDGCGDVDVFVQPGTNHYLVAATGPFDLEPGWTSAHAYFYRSTDMGLTFEPGFQLDSAAVHAARPHVVADAEHVICNYNVDHQDVNNYTQSRTLYTVSDIWGPCTPVSDPSYNSYCSGALAISGDGRVHTALMLNRHDGRYDIGCASSTDHGATWSGHLRVNDDTQADKSYPDIGADKAGYVYVVWEDGRASNPGVWFSTNNPAGFGGGFPERDKGQVQPRVNGIGPRDGTTRDGTTRDRHPISGSFGTSWHLPPADLTSPPASHGIRCSCWLRWEMTLVP